jgi:hypothetical protein
MNGEKPPKCRGRRQGTGTTRARKILDRLAAAPGFSHLFKAQGGEIGAPGSRGKTSPGDFLLANMVEAEIEAGGRPVIKGEARSAIRSRRRRLPVSKE